MMNIPVTFHTNLDDYYCGDITSICISPQIGQVVDVKYKGNHAELKIVRIKHSIRNSRDLSKPITSKEPYLQIELHK